MKKGFILLETIAVLSIICVTLITLYSGYIRIIKNVNTRSYYDNTEYIYKTKTLVNYISKTITKSQIENYDIFIYCNTETYKIGNGTTSLGRKCDASTTDYNMLFAEMNVVGVYITKWNTRNISSMALLSVEPTTQKYIKHINDKNGSGFRIVIMYKDRINSKKFQYASLRFVPEL